MKRREARISARVFAATVALAALWVAGILLAPLLSGRDPGIPDPLVSNDHTPPGFKAETLVSSLYNAYKPVCHQLSDRSIHISGHPMAVCARCFGIYSGFLLGLLIYPLARTLTRTDMPPRLWLIIALAPAGVDFFGGLSGAFENSAASRLVTGLILGTAGAFYIMPGLICMTRDWRGSSSPAGAARAVSPPDPLRNAATEES
ncbi:MAG TPA: DUF2085 domain-containing protein [Blastocatellia bacterium]|jgi:uncharacterized membrane protein|nr:DUF2085 domain-containing protein [Blastocatellia bacterium]